MNSRTRLACGVAIGYLLGRTRKMRLALMVAGATGAAGSPRQLVERGLKQLASVPEVGKLATVARGQLVDAAKTAAMTAASSRIDALNERLQGKAGGDDEEKKPRRASGKERAETDDTGESAPRPDDEDRSDEESAEDSADDTTEDGAEDSTEDRTEDSEDSTADSAEETEEDSDESPRSRRRTSTSRRRASTDDSDDKPRRGSTRRGSRAPVRRAGR
ncbi:hypothetical protein [Actinophytocola sp. KF-1]